MTKRKSKIENLQSTISIETGSPEETAELGSRLGRVCGPGVVIGLVGELGAGKTRFVKGLAEGTGAGDVVTSPTFVLMNQYAGRIGLAHFDLYRLEAVDLGALGYHDVRESSVVVVEWADRVGEEAWGDILRVEFELTGESSRRLMFRATGPRHEALLKEANLSG